MKARVGDLPVGTRITTLLTGRKGVIALSHGQLGRPTGFVPADDSWDSVHVRFEDESTSRRLHPDVRVRVVEVTEESVH